MSRTIYNADPEWDKDKNGTKPWHRQKILSLLHKSDSPFYIQGMINYLGNSITPFDYLQFEHPQQGKLFVFLPTSNLKVYLKDGDDDPHYNSEELNFNECFSEVNRQIISANNKNIRFIIPVSEPGYSGRGHAILLIIDYNAQTNKLTPLIYDSIGRGTIVDVFASFFSTKVKHTSDRVFSNHLNDNFPNITPLRRVAYNHQNRVTSKQCGLFVFRVIYQAITEFSNKGIGELDIPHSDSIKTDSSFLTLEHIASIDECITKKVVKFKNLISGFDNIKLSPEILNDELSNNALETESIRIAL